MAAQSKKPRVLFCFEKWCDCTPECGLSSTFENLSDPLKTSGLGECEFFHPDEYTRNGRRQTDTGLLQRCVDTRPDLLCMLWFPRFMDHLNCTLETLYTIRHEFGIPIATFWSDSHLPTQQQEAEEIMALQDCVIHAIDAWPGTSRPDKHIKLQHPKDPTVYYGDARAPRDIPVLFPGSVLNRSSLRADTLNFLKNEGITVTKIGGQREAQLPTPEYAEYHRRSRIVLNIMDHPNPTMVGRIAEATMCGSLLMQSPGSFTASYLTDGREFVSYTDPVDLKDKLNYYLAHPIECQEIAARGQAKAQELWDGHFFWRSVFEKTLSNASFDKPAALLTLSQDTRLRPDLPPGTAKLYAATWLSTDNAAPAVKLAATLIAAGAFDEACSVFSNVAGYKNISCRDLSAVVRDLTAPGAPHRGHKAALEVVNALREPPSQNELIYFLDMKLRTGPTEPCLPLLRRVFAEQHTDLDAYLNIAEALFCSGNDNIANEILKATQQIFGSSSRLYKGFTRIFERRGL